MKVPETAAVTPEGQSELAANAAKVDKIRKELRDLEEQEVTESLSPLEAARLGLAYLAVGEPRSASHLLRRSAPKKDSDLGTIGTVASALLAQDWGAAHGSLSQRQWDAALKERVEETVECLRIAYLRVVSAAYSTVRVPFLAKMLGLSGEATLSAVKKLGWTSLEPDLVSVSPLPPALSSSPAPDRLSTLTNYVSFLET